MTEVGAVELVATAVGSGAMSTLATVAALKVELRNLRGWVRALSNKVEKATELAQEARYKVDLLEARQ